MLGPEFRPASDGTSLEKQAGMLSTTLEEKAAPATTSVTPFKQAKLLSREEETQLARQYRDQRDPAAGRRLVESHLRLVAKIARQCCSRPAMLPDLIQEGCLGLIRAVEKYDPDRGIRLSSYAAWWIRAFIYQHIMANARMMRVATTFTQRKLFFNLNRECQRLERDGEEAKSKDIAERLGVSEEAVNEMRARLGGREVQFDTTVAVDSGTQQESLALLSAPQRPDEMVEDQQLRSAVAKRLSEVAATLDPRERTIFDERLIAENPITLRELGVRFGISRERARQLENRLKQRLRPLFQEFRGELRKNADVDDEELAA
jgi:RNA polymerase sigma-32 factor